MGNLGKTKAKKRLCFNLLLNPLKSALKLARLISLIQRVACAA